MDKRDNWHINKVRAFVLALSLGTVTTTLGVTIHVPTDYPSITEAVFGSSNYDTILVASGLYVEPNLMIDKVVTVISGTGEADCATIYGAGGEGLKILVWSTLQGFTITGYSEANIIINTGAVLKNLVVTGVNEPTSGMGSYCYGGWSFGE